MNTKGITNAALWALNKLSQCKYYNYSAEQCQREIKDTYDSVNKELCKIIDFDNLTDADCDFLRFGRWEEGNPLRLIPLYLIHLMPKGMIVTSISGNKKTVDQAEKDDDVRYGCTAYGIIPVDKQSIDKQSK